MTIASRGRSTKMADSMGQLLLCGSGVAFTGVPGRNALSALDDHLLAPGKPWSMTTPVPLARAVFTLRIAAFPPSATKT